MIREIKKEDFREKMENKDGNFSGFIFNFEFSLLDYLGPDRSVDFEMDFSKSVFKKEVSFAKVTFRENMSFSRCQTERSVDFFNARMLKNFEAKRTDFFRKVNFNMARFHSDADFSYAVFYLAAHFKKSRFHKNLFMGKTTFFRKIDFSYAHFSNDYYTNFSAVNKSRQIDASLLEPPYFIFRSIFFPKKTIFNDIDLSKTVFQDSIIDSTIFKDCLFPKKGGRNAFYSEIARREKISIDVGLQQLLSEEVNTIILPFDITVEDLNIGDVLEVHSKESGHTEPFFIVTRYESGSSAELRDALQRLNLKKMYSGFNEIICQDCSDGERHEMGVVGFRLKRFDERKHWEVLEDNYRQMKKSLEESRDWQGAGDFYRGEMYAKVKLLESRNEQYWYRKTLCFYRIISAFGESAKRILIVMGLTFVIGSINLAFFKPDLSFFEVMEKNIGFFLPIFGNNAATIRSLEMLPWQDVVVQIEIMWFYLLWLIMAISIRRRFRR